MIFGETHSVQNVRKEIYSRWYRWFAWYPVRFIDGRFTWLQKIERKDYHYDDDTGKYLKGIIYREC